MDGSSISVRLRIEAYRNNTFASTNLFSSECKQRLASDGFYMEGSSLKCFACHATVPSASHDNQLCFKDLSKFHTVPCRRKQLNITAEDTDFEERTFESGVQERSSGDVAGPSNSNISAVSWSEDFLTEERQQGRDEYYERGDTVQRGNTIHANISGGFLNHPNIGGTMHNIERDKVFMAGVGVETPVMHQPTTALRTIGYFWDIENCQVPKEKSAFELVQKIKEIFRQDRSLKVFKTVVDSSKLTPKVKTGLDEANVEICHVDATNKNAADDRLKEFIDSYGSDLHQRHISADVVIITGDCNFEKVIHKLIDTYNHKVFLVHKRNSKSNFVELATKAYIFEDIADNCKNCDTPSKKNHKHASKVYVYNLPTSIVDTPEEEVRHCIENELCRLSDNCRGKVMFVKTTHAMIMFLDEVKAGRAQFRLNGELLFGSKITASYEPPDPLLETCVERVAAIEISDPVTSSAASSDQIDIKDDLELESSNSAPPQSDLASECGDDYSEPISAAPHHPLSCIGAYMKKVDETDEPFDMKQFASTVQNDITKLHESMTKENSILSREVQELKLKAENLSSDNSSLKGEVTEMEKKIKKLEKEKEDWEKEKIALEFKLDSVIEGQEALVKELSKLTNAREEWEKREEEYKEEIHRLKTQISRNIFP